jgi:hypothetical protein
LGRPYIKIKGKRSFWILLDTGYADGYINIHRDSKLLDNNLKVIKQKKLLRSGLNSTKTLDIDYYQQVVHFGDFSKLQQISVSDLKTNIIGSKLPQENHMVIDVLHGKLFLTPVSQEDEKVKISNIGFSFNNGSITVSSLVNKSVFDIAGIQINDSITKINEFKLNDLKDECAFVEIFTKLKFPLTIVFKNGKKEGEITFTKEEYYE